MKKRYSTDLTATQWQSIEKLIKVKRTSRHALKEIVEAVLYWLKNGCNWRDLPKDFPVWQTVYWYYRKWINDNTWQLLSAELTLCSRLACGKKPCPSAIIIDSQSTKNSATATEHIGFDGGKKIKGRKRFALVDTLGNLIYGRVFAANVHDGTTAAGFFESALHFQPLLDDVEKIYADGTFGGTFKSLIFNKFNIEVEIPKVPIAQKGNMSIHEKRWVVERFFAWCGNNRRLAKEYERRIDCSENLMYLVNIRRLLKRRSF